MMRRAPTSPRSVCLRFVAAWWLGGLAPTVGADLAVIVHPASPLQTLSGEQVSDLYLGRRQGFTDSPLLLLDHSPHSPLRERFFRRVAGMELRRVNAYWARLQFSGDTRPPIALADSRQILDAVGRDPLAVGYVDAAQVNKSVRTVLLLREE